MSFRNDPQLQEILTSKILREGGTVLQVFVQSWEKRGAQRTSRMSFRNDPQLQDIFTSKMLREGGKQKGEDRSVMTSRREKG
jgi:hypothetical protein